eukprot:m.33954 g.33954  ORF g.33954 m.33954 type:complete len:1076 (+) comp6488_c0_seq1:200-3427(+)
MHQTHTSSVLFVALSLLLGVICRSLTKKVPGTIPYTVALLIFGVLWGILDIHTTSELGDAASDVGHIDPHLFLQIFLPLLIFESAFSMKWHVFKQLLPQMLLLAVVGVVIATSLTALTLVYVIEPSWSWETCFMLGAIVSATDPVAVVALLKELGGSTKLRTLIEGESLLNDGTAIVIFSVFVDLTGGAALSGGDVAISFLRLALGGIGLGLVWGLVTIWLIGLVYQDTLVETTLTVASTYLLFHVAEEFCHVSGVLAIVTLGASFVWYGNTRISPIVSHSLHEFWEILAYFGETIIFVLAGTIITQKVGFENFDAKDYGRLILFYIFLELIRGFMVLVLSPALRKTGYGFGMRRGLVLVHGGLRGAVSLAMALLVELETDIPEEIRGKVLFYGAGITFLTLVINAPTAGPLVRWLGLLRASRAEEEKFSGGVRILKAAMETEVESMLENTSNESQVQCNWAQVQKFIALDQFIKPILIPRHQSVSIEMVETPASQSTNNLYQSNNSVSVNNEDVSLVFPNETYDEEEMCCARLRRGRIMFTQSELRMQQARLRFLKGTVEIYHSLSKQGQIPSDSLKALLDAEEAAEDKCHKPLGEWKDSLATVCRNPRWLTFLMKHSRVTLWSRVLSWGIRTSLSRGVSVASAYIQAHRYMIASASFDNKTMELLRVESKSNTDMAKAFLDKASFKYKDLVTQIYSEQVTNMLLYKLQNKVGSLSGNGVFLDAEAEMLLAFVQKKQVQILQHKQSFSAPTERDVVVSSHLFHGVHEGVINSLLFQHEEITLRVGESLLQNQSTVPPVSSITNDEAEDEDEDIGADMLEKRSHDYIYFVVSGALEYNHPSGKMKQRVENGTYLNIAEALRELPSTVTYTALSNVKLLRFPGHAIRSLIHSGCTGVDTVVGVDHLSANLVRLAATEVMYLFGNIFEMTSSEELRALKNDSLRSYRGVSNCVKDGDVVIAQNRGNPFEVCYFYLFLSCFSSTFFMKAWTSTSSHGHPKNLKDCGFWSCPFWWCGCLCTPNVTIIFNGLTSATNPWMASMWTRHVLQHRTPVSSPHLCVIGIQSKKNLDDNVRSQKD